MNGMQCNSSGSLLLLLSSRTVTLLFKVANLPVLISRDVRVHLHALHGLVAQATMEGGTGVAGLGQYLFHVMET